MKIKYSNMMYWVQLTVPDHGLGIDSSMMWCVKLTVPDHGLGLDPGVKG
jgi:hypothetical protein